MPVAGAGHLEVHVAEGILLAEDVGQDREAAVGLADMRPIAAPATGGLDRHAGVHEGERRAAGRGHRGRAVGRHALRLTRRMTYGNSSFDGKHRAGAPARRGGRGRSRAGRGRASTCSRRCCRAACCSGGGSASRVSGLIVSIRWTSEDGPSVATVSAWVSPRVKRPEPWARGSRPTSTEIGRISSTPRPSIRIPSARVSLRAVFLWTSAEEALARRGPARRAASSCRLAPRPSTSRWARIESAMPSPERRRGGRAGPSAIAIEELGRRLGVRQGAVGLLELDAEEAATSSPSL